MEEGKQEWLYGKVRAVSKFGGIKLEGREEWFNGATDDVKEEVRQKARKGTEIRLLLDQVGRYRAWGEVPTGGKSLGPAASFDRRGDLIVRQTCIKAAAELHAAWITAHPDKSVGYNTDDVLVAAEALEEWVHR